MLQIEEQIKALQRTKAKIDLYRKLLSNIQGELKLLNEDDEHKILEAEFPGLLSDFCKEVSEFAHENIEGLGNPLKTRGSNRVEPSVNPASVPASSQDANAGPQPEETEDPLRFLLKHRALENKRVRFETSSGPVEGIVRGIVVPNLLIDTDSGYTVPVKPKDLKVVD